MTNAFDRALQQNDSDARAYREAQRKAYEDSLENPVQSARGSRRNRDGSYTVQTAFGERRALSPGDGLAQDVSDTFTAGNVTWAQGPLALEPYRLPTQYVFPVVGGVFGFPWSVPFFSYYEVSDFIVETAFDLTTLLNGPTPFDVYGNLLDFGRPPVPYDDFGYGYRLFSGPEVFTYPNPGSLSDFETFAQGMADASNNIDSFITHDPPFTFYTQSTLFPWEVIPEPLRQGRTGGTQHSFFLSGDQRGFYRRKETIIFPPQFANDVGETEMPLAWAGFYDPLPPTVISVHQCIGDHSDAAQQMSTVGIPNATPLPNSQPILRMFFGCKTSDDTTPVTVKGFWYRFLFPRHEATFPGATTTGWLSLPIRARLHPSNDPSTVLYDLQTTHDIPDIDQEVTNAMAFAMDEIEFEVPKDQLFTFRVDFDIPNPIGAEGLTLPRYGQVFVVTEIRGAGYLNDSDDYAPPG